MNTEPSANRPIGVFDSGIGGLTVVSALMKRLPGESIVYFGDTARVPYGPKSAEVVRTYAKQDTRILVEQNVKFIVVACNTVSAVALDVVEREAPVPVIGVIDPVARIAAGLSGRKKIGVIGTLGTIASSAYTKAIHGYDRAVTIETQACPLFVPLAEEGWSDHEATRLIAREYLQPLIERGIDTLVLGCTHYPILKDVIREITGDGIRLIDSADSTANAVYEALDGANLLRNDDEPPRHVFLVSDVPHRFKEIGERFLGKSLDTVRKVGDFLV